MPPYTNLRTLIEQSVDGKFADVYKAISSKEITLQTNSAVKIVVAVCNSCHKNMGTLWNIKEEELVLLIKCLLKLIHVPTNEQYDSYIQSSFYILKLLIEKKNIATILQLEDLFAPPFMPLILSDKHKSVYQSICKTLYNAIVRMAHAKDITEQTTSVNLVQLLSLLYHKTAKESDHLEAMHNCIVALVMLDVSPEHLLKLYKHIFRPIDRIEDTSVYPLFINNISFLYTHFLKLEQFEFASCCLKFTLEKLRHFKGAEYVSLSHILEIVEWMNPKKDDASIHVPTKAHSSLKSYYNTYQCTRNLQSVCDFVSSVAYNSLQIYKKSDVWLKRLNSHPYFYKFLNDVSLIMAKTKHKCHCKSCPTETNINEALRSLSTIGGLGRLSILKSDVSRIYKLDLLRYLDKATEYISLLKTNGCKKWEKYWYDVGTNLYVLGGHLHNAKDTEVAVMFLRKFAKTSLAVDTNHAIIGNSFFCSALNIIGDAHFESRDYDKCLLVTALAVTLNDSPKSEIVRWMRAKATLREDTIEENRDLQEVTLVSAFDRFASYLRTYTNLELTRERKVDLLEYELKQYNAKWKSKIPMCATFKHLSELADSYTAMRVFVEVWGEADMMVHETLPKILHFLIERVEKDQLKDATTMLAHLYFLQHKYKVKDTMAKHCDEMERTMITTTKSHPESHDPVEECDIVSSYECLKLSRYLSMVKHLNKSLDLLYTSINETPQIEDGNERQRVYKLLANIGHEYRLHSQVAKSLQAWELALKLAKSDQSALHTIQASGFIIEASDVRKPGVQKIVDEADKCVFALKLTNNIADMILYYLCKAEAFLYVDFDVAYQTFRSALKSQNESTDGNKILTARIHLLHHKFIMLPCKFQVQDHREYSLVRIHQAKNCAKSFYCENPTASAYDMRILFDIYESIAQMYHNLRLPREVRCNIRSAVIISQEMVLPLRTTSFLYYLAHADINTNRMDDSRVKIKDFHDILSLASGKTVIKSRQIDKKVEDIVDNLADGLNQIMLDVPQRIPKSTASGSPTFVADRFKLPDFVNHQSDCDCFYCTCVEYQHLVLKETFLNALLHRYDNLMLSKEYFSGCIKVYNCLKTKQEAFVNKMAMKIHADIVTMPRDVFCETYAYTLLEYANFCIRNGKYSDADIVNKKILDTVQNVKLRFQYLYNETFAQKLNLLVLKSEKTTSKTTLAPYEDGEALSNLQLTPESKQTKVFVSPEPISGFLDSYKMLPKAIKFDLSDTDEEIVPASKKPISISKTPAPSSSKDKVKIYTDTKSVKKSKAVLTEIPAFKAADTPLKADTQIENHLVNRTKMLTERLKGSSRKVKVCDENRKCGVKQNLMSQLNDAENDDKGKPVRRSARNRN